jgi:hypothetical protein
VEKAWQDRDYFKFKYALNVYHIFCKTSLNRRQKVISALGHFPIFLLKLMELTRVKVQNSQKE